MIGVKRASQKTAPKPETRAAARSGVRGALGNLSRRFRPQVLWGNGAGERVASATDDLRALKAVVLERIETLAEQRLRKVDWESASELSLQDLLSAAYTEGARDALDYPA